MSDKLSNSATTPASVGLAISPDGDGWATPWDRSVVSEPREIFPVGSGGDVVAALSTARRQGASVAVRCTGHGATPLGSEVILVHTGRMNECTIHPDGRWARVGAGATWQQVVDAAAPHGLAPVCGSAPAVGVVGYLTGGGIGPFARSYGVSSDYVRAFDVATAQGVLVRATPSENADLFWGLRGGKGTLGVVVAVDIDLIPVGAFYGGCLWFASEHTAAVLHHWLGMCAGLPEAGTTSVAIMRLPAVPQLPSTIAGRQTVAVRFAWTGLPEDGERYVAELRRRWNPLHDDVKVRPLTEVGRVHGDPTRPMPLTTAAALLKALPPALVDPFLEAVGEPENRQSIVEIRQLGGAISRPPLHPSAYCHRDAAFSLFTSGLAGPGTVDHASRILRALAPVTYDGLLANFSASDDPETISRYYDPQTYRRLTDLAEKYDPDRLLRVGQVARAALPAGVIGGRIPMA